MMRILARLCSVFGMFVLVMSLALLIARRQTPQPPWIAFTSNRNGVIELYKMRPDGSHQTRLTYNHAIDLSPTWSPDGAWIAFTTERYGTYQLARIAANGKVHQALTTELDGLSLPDWSPDGQWIAFNWGTGIFKLALDSRELIRITPTSIQAYAPSWSPDGQWIAFVESTGHLYRIEAGGEATPLPILLEGRGAGPDWSPDGEQIAFFKSYLGGQDLYLTRHDGSQTARLGRSPAAEWFPDWSPDGQWLAFELQTDHFRNSDIYLVRSDGSQTIPITRTPRDSDRGPAWSPIIDLPLRFGILFAVAAGLLTSGGYVFRKSPPVYGGRFRGGSMSHSYGKER